jgi:phosphohistidine phosphatase SixA
MSGGPRRETSPAQGELFATEPQVVLLAYLRHGHIARTSSPSEKRSASLTDRGREAAREAAQWLRTNNFVPDRVITTSTTRTAETANVVLQRLGVALEPRQTRSGFSQRSLDAKVNQWASDSGVAASNLLFCGHHTQQQALASRFDLAIPVAARGAVIVAERDADRQWHLVGWWPGLV